jgi:hypothetical protein
MCVSKGMQELFFQGLSDKYIYYQGLVMMGTPSHLSWLAHHGTTCPCHSSWDGGGTGDQKVIINAGNW